MTARPALSRPTARRPSDLEAGIAPWELGFAFGLWDARSVVGADGDLVSSVSDAALGRFGVAMTAATTARPLLGAGANGIRGRNCLRFNDQTSNHTVNVMTADAAAAQFAGQDVPVTYLAVGTIEAAAGAACWISLGKASTSNPSHRLALQTNDKPRQTRADDTAASVNVNSFGDALAVSVPACIASRHFGTLADLWQAGRQLIVPTACDVGTMTVDRLSMGARRGATVTNLLNGKLALLLVMAGAPRNDQMRGLMVWASREFGLTV